MIDTRTISPPASDTLALPFDWQCHRVAKQSSIVQHDYSNPCVAPGHGAVVLQEHALGLDDTLQTAVIISLFSDRRAGRDVVLPRGQADRRGWCGDEFAKSPDPWGSLLWTCYFTKTTVDKLEEARFAAWEALQWMVAEGLAQRISVTALWAGENADRLALRPQIWQDDGDMPIYDVLWGTTLRKSL